MVDPSEIDQQPQVLDVLLAVVAVAVLARDADGSQPARSLEPDGCRLLTSESPCQFADPHR
jgi:hypothetical protein